MSVDLAGPSAPPAPVAPRPRVLRLTLIAVTVVAALIALPTLAVWAWGPGRSTNVWAGHFGDPAITVAKRALIPQIPHSLLVWDYRTTTYGLPGDTSILASAFGGPVKEVKPGIWATATGTVNFPGGDPAAASRASGIIDALDFHGPTLAAYPAAATFPTQTAQETEARRILTAFGWAHQPGTQPDLTFTTGPAGETRIVASPHVPGSSQEPTFSGAPDASIVFGADGTLRQAILWTKTTAASPTATTLISARQAIDDLRHHRGDSLRPQTYTPNLIERLAGVTFFDDVHRPTPPGAIITITLIGDTRGQDNGHTNPAWVFTDRDGATVGTVLALRGATYPS